MDDMFGGKAWCKPVAIASSTGVTVRNNNESGTEEGDSGCSSSMLFRIQIIVFFIINIYIH